MRVVRTVSVPSRGILFPNNIESKVEQFKAVKKFPSPLGVSYFQIKETKFCKANL